MNSVFLRKGARGTAVFLLSAGTTLSANAAAPTKKASALPKDRPNILWLTFEDASWYLFGCYGNTQVHTPVMDSLAREGVLFTNAWASAPQSSPARSSLITGCYATTYGMDFHPYPFDTPEGIFFPQLLRDAGYYCTNNNKTHYNTTLDHKSCWDECDKTASYNSPARAEGQPFFAVFNTVTSHMGRYRTFHTDGRRDYTQEGIYPSLLELPGHLPDLPQVRSDYAANLEAAQDVDKWVGMFLQDLRDRGLADNTIIFVFSDHGGCQPRGKGYVYETGLRVPMIAYFPPRYRDLWQGAQPGEDDRLVNFVDLGPTVLSLAGIKTPKTMQGKALAGRFAASQEREIDFALTANQLHHFVPMRAARDKRYKYIRSYIPYRQEALRNYYQWGMPANKAWDEFVLLGRCSDPVYELPFRAHPSERLYDLSQDIFETNDLSGDAAMGEALKKLSEAVSEHIRQTVDLGFFLPTTRGRGVLYDMVRTGRYPLAQLYDLVEKAGVATVSDFDYLCEYLGSEYDEMRFWAVVGMAVLATGGHLPQAPGGLVDLMADDNPYVAAEAALACAYAGRGEEAVKVLACSGGEEYRKVFFSALECLALDPSMRELVMEELPALEQAARDLPRVQNEDAGLMARGILADLGVISVWDIHGPESYQVGLKLNHGRRKMVPLP